MKTHINQHTNLSILALAVYIGLFALSSCKKLVDNDPSRTQLLDEEVYKDSATVKSAVAGLYSTLSYTNPYKYSLSTLPGFSADELRFIGSSQDAFINNALRSDNGAVAQLWSAPYQTIYGCNSIIEGLQSGTNMTDQFKNQAMGEARFIRALGYFYLVNVFGDVPLILTTDVILNTSKGRDPVAAVYSQILDDLKFAQANLREDYAVSGGERTRANKWSATALLARTQLYLANWTEAESEATSLIENTALFGLPGGLSEVFEANSREAILQFHNDLNGITGYATEVLPNPVEGTARYIYSPQLEAAFEAGDLRKGAWSAPIDYNGTPYRYPAKYKDLESGSNSEYYTIFRLAEQYLIRAEARARRNNVSGAQADLLTIRKRADLGPTPANDQPSLLLAVEQERRIELNAEWGHRWFDLKRTNRANAVLGPIKTTWNSNALLYPIPAGQRILNRNLTQNQGYN
jgi:starch-binding outer membrane protein, SusD/RagB family